MNDVSPSPAPLTAGAHHVALTVPDLAAAVAFFTDALGHCVEGDIRLEFIAPTAVN